jgi:hypothetical protein
MGTTSKWFFVSRLPSGSPEIPTVGTFTILGVHNFACKPAIAMRSKAKLYPLSRAFQWYVARRLHARKSGRFWLLVVESQTGCLTIGFSFDNLCFRCPNGQCEPILDIYASIHFQWYRDFFEAMGFDPYNRTLKIWKSIWDSNSQHGSSLWSVRVHSLTLFALPRACEMILGSPSWPATLQPLTLVASPRLGLWHSNYHMVCNYKHKVYSWRWIRLSIIHFSNIFI